jgi:hypothetical protein
MPLLKEKTSKLGSVFSFMAVSLLIVLFFLALPEFFLSTTGRMFVVLWAFVAICVFLAHGRRISMRRRRVRASLSAVHTKRTHSTPKSKRLLRG